MKYSFNDSRQHVLYCLFKFKTFTHLIYRHVSVFLSTVYIHFRHNQLSLYVNLVCSGRPIYRQGLYIYIYICMCMCVFGRCVRGGTFILTVLRTAAPEHTLLTFSLLSAVVVHSHNMDRNLPNNQFKIICITLFTIQSLQSNFKGN